MTLSYRKRSDEELISFSTKNLRLRTVSLFNSFVFSDHVLQTRIPTNGGAPHVLAKVAAGSFGSSIISKVFKLQSNRGR